MLYAAYFDEADKQGPMPTVIMASFLGAAREGELLGRGLCRLQRDHGFAIFVRPAVPPTEQAQAISSVFSSPPVAALR